jgi:hypothetical protein
MTRLSDKVIIDRTFPQDKSLVADFELPEIEATIRDKAYDVIYEKAYICPCKGSGSPGHLNVCRNCGGSGWIFANPTKTRMLISGIAADGKLKEAALREWGMIDGGVVKVTALNADKFTYMDRITVLDATAEHNQIIYPTLTDDDTTLFAFTKYNIISINFLGLFVDSNTRLTKLTEPTDYSFDENIVTLSAAYNNMADLNLTIRYSHQPVFHIIDIVRESMTSSKGQYRQNMKRMLMPVHATAKRAHLIKDIENYGGDRLLDNSWLPNTCEVPDLTKFQRQLRYASAQEIFNNLTQQQMDDLDDLFHASSI